MNFLELLVFILSIPGYIADFIQLVEFIVEHFKQKAKAPTTKVSADQHREE